MTFALQALVPQASATATASATARTGAATEPAATQPVTADSFGALLAGVLKSEAQAPVHSAGHPAAGGQSAEDNGEARDGAADRSGGEHAGAGGATGSTAAADPVHSTSARHVRRDMDGLDPEFRTRLQRVIQRMEQEGHTVRVNETVRSQERQEWLYAQGRTRPGPVVTWTLNSNHAQGRAADLVIDNSYNNPQGYARLAAIAAEEGLRTLGPRDAGHVELPRSGAAPHSHTRDHGHGDAAMQPRSGANGPGAAVTAGPPGMATVASVATVAAVARPADVARVARVATVAAPGSVAVPAAHNAATNPVAGVQVAAAPDAGSTDGGSNRRHAGPAQAVEAMSSSADSGDTQPRAGFMDARGSGAGTRAVAGAGELQPVDVAARVAKILEMQQGSAPRKVSSVLLRMDNGGAEDRVRLDLRGNAVDARIELSDPAAARRADTQLHELRAALLRGGLDPQALRVSSTSPEAAELLRAALLAEDARPQPGRSSDQPPHRRPHDDAPGRQEGEPADPHGRGGNNPQRKGSR